MKLSIVPVTSANRNIVERLEVYPNQRGYIESVRECLQEADTLKEWQPVCIINDNIIVGFAMYGLIHEKKYTRLWFDRLLIDKKYQRQGYAKRTLEILLQQMIAQYPDTDIYLSVYEENQAAISLYRAYGFHFSGEIDTKGEKIMVLKVGCGTL